MTAQPRSAAELEAIHNFRRRIKEKELTLAEVGEMINFSSQMSDVFRTECRVRRLTLEVFVDLCSVLDMTPSEALGFEEKTEEVKQ